MLCSLLDLLRWDCYCLIHKCSWRKSCCVLRQADNRQGCNRFRACAGLLLSGRLLLCPCLESLLLMPVHLLAKLCILLLSPDMNSCVNSNVCRGVISRETCKGEADRPSHEGSP